MKISSSIEAANELVKRRKEKLVYERAMWVILLGSGEFLCLFFILYDFCLCEIDF